MPLLAKQPNSDAWLNTRTSADLVDANALNPLTMFQTWLQEAVLNKQVLDASSVNLATVSAYGQPSNRMVTMRDYDDHGFVFFTNPNSHKGLDVTANPKVSLCFFWEPMGRQIRIEGQVKPINCEEADSYFSKQPREHQVRAWVSQQSQVLADLPELKREVIAQTYKSNSVRIPRPPSWSGYRVKPHMMEFWQSGEFGLDNRACFSLNADRSWDSTLLAP